MWGAVVLKSDRSLKRIESLLRPFFLKKMGKVNARKTTNDESLGRHVIVLHLTLA